MAWLYLFWLALGPVGARVLRKCLRLHFESLEAPKRAVLFSSPRRRKPNTRQHPSWAQAMLGSRCCFWLYCNRVVVLVVVDTSVWHCTKLTWAYHWPCEPNFRFLDEFNLSHAHAHAHAHAHTHDHTQSHTHIHTHTHTYKHTSYSSTQVWWVQVFWFWFWLQHGLQH